MNSDLPVITDDQWDGLERLRQRPVFSKEAEDVLDAVLALRPSLARCAYQAMQVDRLLVRWNGCGLNSPKRTK